MPLLSGSAAGTGTSNKHVHTKFLGQHMGNAGPQSTGCDLTSGDTKRLLIRDQPNLFERDVSVSKDLHDWWRSVFKQN